MHMQYKRHKIWQHSLYQHISEPFHHVHVHKMFQENGKDGTFKHEIHMQLHVVWGIDGRG